MKKLRDIGCGCLLGVMLVFGVLWVLVKDDSDFAPAAETTAVELLHGESTMVIPTATARPIAPPYNEIVENVKGKTEAQWKAYLPTLEGNSVIDWTGRVGEVNVMRDGYELWVNMRSTFSSRDVVFDISDDIALELKMDQAVVFSGTIDRVTEFLGSVTVHLKDASLWGESQ